MEPLVSIVVPVSRTSEARDFLLSLNGVDYPAEKIELFFVEGDNPPRQRNLAVKKARGEFVFFFDDDVVLRPDVLKKALGHYSDKKVVAVGGPNLTPEKSRGFEKFSGYALGSFFGTAGMRRRYRQKGRIRLGGEKELILCNMSVRRSVFEKLGGFNEALFPNEENELLKRLEKEGKIMYDPGVVVLHSRRKSIFGFSKQLFSYGKGRAKMSLFSPSTFSFLFLLPSLFLLYVFSLFFFRPYWYLLPLFVYVFSDFVFSLRESLRHRDFLAFVFLANLFPVLHLSYGAGFVAGLLKYPFEGKKPSPISYPVKLVSLGEKRK